MKVLDDTQFEFSLGEEKFEYPFGIFFKNKFGEFIIELDSTSTKPDEEALVQFSSPGAVAIEYANKLDITQISGTSLLTMSMLDAVPEKAKDVIDSLIVIYNLATVHEKNQVGDKTLQFIEDRLRYLTGELTAVELDVEQYMTNNDVLVDVEREVEFSFDKLRESDKKLVELELKSEMLSSMFEIMKDDKEPFEFLPYTIDINNTRLTEILGGIQ